MARHLKVQMPKQGRGWSIRRVTAKCSRNGVKFGNKFWVLASRHERSHNRHRSLPTGPFKIVKLFYQHLDR